MEELILPNWYLDFLKHYEGFRPEAYFDKNKYSIGYGSGKMPNGRLVKKGDKINKQEAEALITSYFKNAYPILKQYLPNFDNYPEQTKMALLDMAYRGGENFLGKSPKFKKAFVEGMEDGVITEEELNKLKKEQDNSDDQPGVVKRKNQRMLMLANMFDTNNSTTYQPYPKSLKYNQVQAVVDRTNQNPTQNFVQRLLDKNRTYIPDWQYPGYIATHKLSYATEGDKDIIYPNVQEKEKTFLGFPTGEKILFDYTDPKNKTDWKAALNDAIQTGDTIQVPIGLGEHYTKLYKTYYPNLKKGGVLYKTQQQIINQNKQLSGKNVKVYGTKESYILPKNITTDQAIGRTPVIVNNKGKYYLNGDGVLIKRK